MIIVHYALQFLTRPIALHRMAIRDFVAHAGKDKIVMLDFGCGEGIFSGIFAGRKGLTYIGADRDLAMLRQASARNRDGLFLISDHNLCFKDRVFDIIVLNCVLHHLGPGSLKVLVQELRRVLSQDGVILVIELNPPEKQKGFFFRCVTFAEEKLKRIVYFDERAFYGVFRKLSSRPLGDNFMEYIFSV